ncbi:hypothetical protein D3C87_1729580 [compost metagenome]
MTTAELNTVNAECRAQTFGQLGRNALYILRYQTGPELGPTLADESGMVRKRLVIHLVLFIPVPELMGVYVTAQYFQ